MHPFIRRLICIAPSEPGPRFNVLEIWRENYCYALIDISSGRLANIWPRFREMRPRYVNQKHMSPAGRPLVTFGFDLVDEVVGTFSPRKMHAIKSSHKHRTNCAATCVYNQRCFRHLPFGSYRTENYTGKMVIKASRCGAKNNRRKRGKNFKLSSPQLDRWLTR